MTVDDSKKFGYSVSDDEDYKNLKAWQYDSDALIQHSMRLGGIYEGILEAVQNALDSPDDRFEDYLRIDITIPFVNMPEYGEFIARVQDTGGSITKDFDGQIAGYIDFVRAISPKKEHRWGFGMGQYFNVGQKFVIVSMDDELIYRIPSVLNERGSPANGKYTVKSISESEKEKHGIYNKGTIITWTKPWGNATEINLMKLANKIRETFGWRMLEQQRTEIFINGVKLALPDILQGKEVGFICKLNPHEIKTPKGMIRVNPVVVGFIEKNSKGTGHLEVYAGGGYYYRKYKFAHKRFSGAISINEMTLDVSRTKVDDESMWLDLEQHIIEYTKHFPDIPLDDTVSEKQQKSMSEVLNKVLKRFNIPKLQILKLELEKKKRREVTGIVVDVGPIKGYPKSKEKDQTEIPLCDLCGHRQVKNTKGKRKGCECDCHIPRPKGPNEEHGVVILDENGISVMVEDAQDNQKDRSGIKLRLLPDPPESNPPLLELGSQGNLDIYEYNPLFKRLDLVKHTENIFPYLAHAIIDLEHPDAATEKSPGEYRKMIQDYTIGMLDDM